MIFGGEKKWRVTLEGRDLAADKPFLQNIWVLTAGEEDARQIAIAALTQAQAEFIRIVESGRHKSNFRMLPEGTYAEGRIYFET